ncbi:hypothetical protein VTN77DRAFT_6940 [Rasamsonia byssochlamydoides]|uniref:uncharacterized protein n=1 Tax=Rasamsonia byssochlamydoides TaxID=89139 RepID=UPI0037420E0A
MMESTDRGSKPLPTPLLGRQRAPTITIDTAAGDHEPPSFTRLSSPTYVEPASADRLRTPESPNVLTVPDCRSRASSIGSRPRSPSSYGGETLTPTSTSLEHSRSRSSSANTAVIVSSDHDGGPWKAGQRTFRFGNGPFAIAPETLEQMLEWRSLADFHALGGIKGLAALLRTDCSSGLSRDETTLNGTGAGDQFGSTAPHAVAEPHAERRLFFGSNRLPERGVKSIFQLMWIAFNDKVLILLATVATISLGLGLYQTFGQPHKPGQPKVEWVEGVTIMVAVAIVVIVGALNDYQKERQFAKLNEKKEDRLVKAIRSGKSMEISVYDVVVGDILHLEPGDLVPADGVCVSGHNIRCDESSATGESDQMKKTPGDEIMARIESGASVDKLDPFILSGSKVLEGVGTYMVTGVGVRSTYGRLLMSLAEETGMTPLQQRLTVVAEQIATAGISVAVLLFFVLFIKFLAQLGSDVELPFDKGQTFLRIVIVSITVVVIAVPEGLPLAVTLALAIAVTKMLKDNNLVRILSSCETMGNATTVCCDKTGTLTMNKMTVVTGMVGTAYQFGDSAVVVADEENGGQEVPKISTVSVSKFVSLLADEVRHLISQSVVINSTAFEGEEDGKPVFIGSKTETALLSFAKEHLGIGAVAEERANAQIVQMVPFDSNRKCMACVVKLGGIFRMYVKGAPEILLDKSTRVVADVTDRLGSVLIEDNRELLLDTIERYSSHSLRTIGLAYRDFRSWPPPGAQTVEDDPTQVVLKDILEDLTFIGIFGIQDPLRPGVDEAVAKCQRAGVTVRMVTGDNLATAKAVATQCGILDPDGLAMEGASFRKLSTAEMDQIIPRLQVLARSTPEDKRILVRRLKALGEIVAVTGDGTNDGPALRAADVGFSMGISGTGVAKEASSIILMDDNFSSIVKAIEWGRAVNDSIKKFLQFQLTVNVTAVTLTFVSAIASENEESILTPVQLLWVNLIMDTFAALALATDPPSPGILDRKPEPRSAPLVSLTMWKMIIGQSLYQLVVTLVLNFAGNRILGYTGPKKDELETLVFNTYVWMQFFNQYNNRRLDNKLNVFEGIHRNWYFIVINLITIAGQVIIIFFGGSALSAMRLDGVQWVISLVLGSMSLLVGVIVRLIPNDLIRAVLPIRFGQHLAPRVRGGASVRVPHDAPSNWDEAREVIREELAFRSSELSHRRHRFNWREFKRQCRRRLRLSSLFGSTATTFKPDDPEAPLLWPASSSPLGEDEDEDYAWSQRPKSAIQSAAAMAGIIAGSVAAWPSMERVSVSNAFGNGNGNVRVHT